MICQAGLFQFFTSEGEQSNPATVGYRSLPTIINLHSIYFIPSPLVLVLVLVLLVVRKKLLASSYIFISSSMKLSSRVDFFISILFLAAPVVVVAQQQQINTANYCGATWVDAVACQLPCPSGAPADCAAGETCFANTPVREKRINHTLLLLFVATIHCLLNADIRRTPNFCTIVIIISSLCDHYFEFYNLFRHVLIITSSLSLHVNPPCFHSVRKPNCSATNAE